MVLPIIFSSAKLGWAVNDVKDAPGKNLEPLLDMVLKHVPLSTGNVTAPLQFQVTSLDYND